MKNFNPLILLYAGLIFFNFSCQRPTPLFEPGMTNWEEKGEASWQFDTGGFGGTANDNAGMLVTKQTYQDFELTLEFQPDSTVNSGIFIRCANQELSFTDCYEINIWDLHPNQSFRTGAIVARASPLDFVQTLNKWNTYRIKCQGDRIQAWVNGVLTADLRDSSRPSGYIALQAAGTGRINFRNVQLKVK